MIETALVYIYSVSPAPEFVGCGALVEGGYIATCRHVWRDATAETGEPPEVEIEFPFAEDNGVACRARLADVCGGLDARAPDLVLLKPDSIPGGVMTLQLARDPEFETGPGQCHCCLKTRDIDSFIDGEIRSRINLKGMRQFTGSNGQSHWMEEGSSGSPVFLKEKAQQLAGIIALAEIGSKKGEPRLCEAFIVPATMIHKYLRALLERLAADHQAEKRGIDPAKLQPILAKLGQMDVPDDKIAECLDASVEERLAQAAKPVPVSNDGADIDAAIVASRAKLGVLDTAGALDVLQAKIAEEEQQRVRRLVPLLKERAVVERLAFDYEAAKSTLMEVTQLASDDVWAFIDLGDLYVTTGPLEEAAKAFRNAEAAARRQGDERDLSVAFNKLGDVQVAQGDLAGALKSFQDGLAIADKLAKADPGHTGWQRDLSVSYERIGDVQVAQGDLAGALKSFQDSLAIADKLAKAEPGNAEWQRDLSVSFGDVQVAQGDLAGALKSFQDSLAIADKLAKAEPGNAEWQRDLSVSYSKIGDVQVAQGDLASALKSFQDSLAIADKLAKADPGHTGWQRDLSVSNERLGDIFLAQGNLPAALEQYRASVERMVPIRDHDSSNADLQRFTSVTFAKLALVHKHSGDNTKARNSLRQGQAIMSRLTKFSPDNAQWKKDLAEFDRLIAELAEQ